MFLKPLEVLRERQILYIFDFPWGQPGKLYSQIENVSTQRCKKKKAKQIWDARLFNNEVFSNEKLRTVSLKEKSGLLC